MTTKEIAKKAYIAGRGEFDKIPSRCEDCFESWYDKAKESFEPPKPNIDCPVHEWLKEVINPKIGEFFISFGRYYAFKELYNAFVNDAKAKSRKQLHQVYFIQNVISFFRENGISYSIETRSKGRSIKLLF